MKPTALDRLLDIEKAIEQIEAYCAEHTEESFLEDERDQSAVCWQLLAIGEASAKLSPDFRERHDGIPWRLIIGTRNFLAHGYNVVRPERIWNIVVVDLPELKRDILQLIKSLEE